MRVLAIAAWVSTALCAFTLARAESVAPASFASLPSLRFSNQSSGESANIRLYDDAGHIDEEQASRLDALLSDTRDPKNCATITLDRRTLQLAVRAAFHFHV